MRVFVTGATGFVGSAVVRELLAAGHQVLGLARSDAGAQALARQGAAVHLGALEDTGSLVAGAAAADGVIHTAFIHDFSRFEANVEIDRLAVGAMTGALEGSGKPFVLTSGTGMLAFGRAEVRVSTENDAPASPAIPRAASEARVLEVSGRGVRGIVLRLPQVHGAGDHAFVPRAIAIARDKGFAAYVGEGANRWPAVHRFDLARLYRLALEKAAPGTRLHGVAEEGIAMRVIAETIGQGLGIPVRSISAEAAAAHFDWLARFAMMDNPTSSAITRATMGWHPEGPDLLTDMREAGYFA